MSSAKPARFPFLPVVLLSLVIISVSVLAKFNFFKNSSSVEVVPINPELELVQPVEVPLFFNPLFKSAQEVIDEINFHSSNPVNLNFYLLINSSKDLSSGLYQYLPSNQQRPMQLQLFLPGSFNEQIFSLVPLVSFKNPLAILIITSSQTHEQVYLTAGQILQNLYLTSKNFKINLNNTSNFDQAKLSQILSLPSNQNPILLVSVSAQ